MPTQITKPKAGFFVAVHAWTTGTPSFPGGFNDITPFVRGCRWGGGVNEPWGSATLILDIPSNLLFSVLPGRKVSLGPLSQANAQSQQPNPNAEFSGQAVGYTPETGFWVAIGHTATGGGVAITKGRKKGYGLYRARQISVGMSVEEATGLKVTDPITVVCQNWLSFVGGSHVNFSPVDLGWGVPGMTFTLKDWAAAIDAQLESVFQRPLGELWAKLWPILATTVFPPTLGGKEAGNQIPIVYDEATAQRYAPMRAGSCEPVVGYELQHVVTPPGSTLLSILKGLFAADPRVVEIFPSVEYWSDAVPTEGVTALGTALGASPVLIYRMRPWLLQAITAENVSKSVGIPMTGQTACEQVNMAQSPSSTDPGVMPLDWYNVPAHHVLDCRWSWYEEDRVNKVYAGTFATGADPATEGVLNHSLVRDTEEIRRHGLRKTDVKWPFMSAEIIDSTSSQPTLPSKPETNPAVPAVPGSLLTLSDLKDGTDQVPPGLAANANLLLQNLELILAAAKVKFGLTDAAICIICGMRTKAHNDANIEKSKKAHNGKSQVAQNSEHLRAAAADFKITTKADRYKRNDGKAVVTMEALHDLIFDMIVAKTIAQGGLGIYNGWVHYDVRGTAVQTWDDREKAKKAAVKTGVPKGLGTALSGAAAPPPSEITVPLYAEAITELGWALCAESERFCRGSAVIQYRPFIGEGHYIKLIWKGLRLSAYIEAFEHDVEVEQGNGVVTGTTVITFSRGTLKPYFGGRGKVAEENYIPLMSKELNAKGSTTASDAVLLQNSAFTTGGAGKANTNQLIYDYYPIPNGARIPGAVLSEKPRKTIVLHQSGTMTVRALIALFQKGQTGPNGLYYRGTNYTVDKDGSVIEWADPGRYHTIHAWSGVDALPVDESISIDFIGAQGAAPTGQQVEAGAALVAKLATRFSIPLNAAPPRTSADEPVVWTSEDGDVYGVFLQSGFSKDPTSSPKINPQGLIDMIGDLGLTGLQQGTDATYVQRNTP